MMGDERQNNMEMGNNSEVIAAIREMASAITENYREKHTEDAEDRVLRIQGEFRKSKPSVFKGSSNPMIAEEWLRQMKRSLTNQRIPEDLQVIIACTYLESQAYHWWESVLCIPNTVITTWDGFERVFLEKYFPSTQRRQKAKEFANLRQMLMSVGDYQAKFEELMHFAPELVTDDFAKARRFEEGLRFRIKEKVLILKLDRYIDVVERALMAEQMIQEAKASWQALNKYKDELNRKRQRPNHVRYSTSYRPSRPPLICYKCREEGHVASDCPQFQTHGVPQNHYRDSMPTQHNGARPQVRPPAARYAGQQAAVKPQIGAKRKGRPVQNRVYDVRYDEGEVEFDEFEYVDQFQEEEEVEVKNMNSSDDVYDCTVAKGTLTNFNTWV